MNFDPCTGIATDTVAVSAPADAGEISAAETPGGAALDVYVSSDFITRTVGFGDLYERPTITVKVYGRFGGVERVLAQAVVSDAVFEQKAPLLRVRDRAEGYRITALANSVGAALQGSLTWVCYGREAPPHREMTTGIGVLPPTPSFWLPYRRFGEDYRGELVSAPAHVRQIVFTLLTDGATYITLYDGPLNYIQVNPGDPVHVYTRVFQRGIFYLERAGDMLSLDFRDTQPNPSDGLPVARALGVFFSSVPVPLVQGDFVVRKWSAMLEMRSLSEVPNATYNWDL